MAKKEELLKKLSVAKLKKLAKEKGINLKVSLYDLGALKFGRYSALDEKDKLVYIILRRGSNKIKISDIEKKLEKRPTKKVEIKRRTFKADFYYLMEKQKGLCAYKKCAELHGRRQPVTTTRDIDHKIPKKLWELKGKKGNFNARSNLQLLCPDCHRRKTAEDRKKIATYKEKTGTKSTKKN